MVIVTGGTVGLAEGIIDDTHGLQIDHSKLTFVSFRTNRKLWSIMETDMLCLSVINLLIWTFW